KAEELLEEVMLSLTLNQLRGNDNHTHNVCPTFIQTLRQFDIVNDPTYAHRYNKASDHKPTSAFGMGWGIQAPYIVQSYCWIRWLSPLPLETKVKGSILTPCKAGGSFSTFGRGMAVYVSTSPIHRGRRLRVCDGTYDDSMIRAWEQWDKKHISENDHPTEFAEKQRFVVFVQEHGGQDLESFVLLSFNDARSLLVQVTVALAVAEAAFEFEHRDLHWGNILLSRKSSETLHFVLDGKKMQVKTYGLVASIIDFTLSRINTGEDILFLDLSLDPGLFEGPKGDKQSETYRKMKEVTEDCWEGSFPKTNVLWLQYLVDILLLKKVYDRTSRDERELRSLKKRLNGYKSAKESIVDPFFSDLIIVSDI
ncbi:serine/threonine-protein kinase haspin homolog isoform X1, partial [Tanacetum coccineum]